MRDKIFQNLSRNAFTFSSPPFTALRRLARKKDTSHPCNGAGPSQAPFPRWAEISLVYLCPARSRSVTGVSKEREGESRSGVQRVDSQSSSRNLAIERNELTI